MGRGLYPKYQVVKASDGSPVDVCFVLRPDVDQAALVALRAYAATTDDEQLAADLRSWLQELEDDDQR